MYNIFRIKVNRFLNKFGLELIRRTKLYYNLYRKYKDFTMIPEKYFFDNIEIVKKFSNKDGCVVECGVWRGGMIAAIADVLGTDREYYLLDSFEGLPEAKPIDGKAAMDWQKNTTSKNYRNNCRAEMDYAIQAMKLSKAKDFHLIKGWFSETLPKLIIGQIAILRLDGDWYESTLDCLKYLYPKVVIGGIVIIDDYYTWDGCTKAVHDYFSKRKLSTRINQINNRVAYLIKQN